MWQFQSRIFTTNLMAIVNLCLPKISATKIVTWECHIDCPIEIRYNMIIGKDLLNEMGLHLKFSEHVIIGYDGPYER